MLSNLVFVQLNASNRHNKYSPGIRGSKGDYSTECLEGFWDPLVSWSASLMIYTLELFRHPS